MHLHYGVIFKVHDCSFPESFQAKQNTDLYFTWWCKNRKVISISIHTMFSDQLLTTINTNLDGKIIINNQLLSLPLYNSSWDKWIRDNYFQVLTDNIILSSSFIVPLILRLFAVKMWKHQNLKWYDNSTSCYLLWCIAKCCSVKRSCNFIHDTLFHTFGSG